MNYLPRLYVLPVLCLLNILLIPGRLHAQQAAYSNVRNFGAKGDGTTPDAKAIDEAIAQTAANGGGTVYFPPGSYLSATIHLQSHVTLYLEQGATIVAAPKGYDLPEENENDQYQDYGHSHFNNSLIVGTGLSDIAILGPGRIWGKGLLRDSVRNGSDEGLGNKTISLKQCHNVTLRDFSILHGGWFGALLNAVDNLTIDNVKMDTDRDGIDVISCKNVRIINCLINSPQDDAICLKSDYALGYTRATENVMIVNCQVSGYDEGTLLDGTFQVVKRANRTGRIKLGTESNGGFRNITITNCVFDYSRGLALETVDGGPLEDVTISNITMRHIVNSPLFIRLGERMRGPAGAAAGTLKRVVISNMIAFDVPPMQGAVISGTKAHPIEELTLTNIHFYYNGGGGKELTAIKVPELEKDYPEPARFGRTPAYGFFIRHVCGLQLSDVHTSFLTSDLRYAITLEDVEKARLLHIDAQISGEAGLLQLKEVKDITIRDCAPVKDTHLTSIDERIL